MARVLLVDDDEGVRAGLGLALRSLGHDVSCAENGAAALAHVALEAPDVVILDVMMPGLDGIATLRRLRDSSELPVLLLTARGMPDDIVRGLEAGADDYVVKPAEPRVLDARLRALLRRVDGLVPAVLTVGDLTVDESAAEVTRAGERIALTATEFRLLTALMRHAGRVLSRSQLLDLVWDYGYDGDSRLVDATIQRLRAKLEPYPSHPRYVTTVRGLGYRVEKR